MKYGARFIRPEGLPRELFAKQLADTVYMTVMELSDADEYSISLVEFRDGELR